MKNKQFIQLYYFFFDKKLAPLSPNAIAGYLHLRRRYNGKNNGLISFSCRELADCLGKSKSTAKNIFDELIQNGLINKARDSHFNVKYQLARLWTINGLKNKKSVQHINQSVQHNKLNVELKAKDGAKN